MTAPRLTRTYLAVPAHRARFVQNAAASAADAVFMDLEDAVPPAEKSAALEAAALALTAHDWGRKTVSIRLNAIDSPTIEQEIARLAGIPRLDAFIIPKAETVSDITKISRWIAAASGTRSRLAEMELLIETARGLVNVEVLAGADPLVTALHLGVGDFAASIGARSAEIGASPSAYRHVGSAADGHPEVPLDLFAYPMMRLLVAARAFGLRAIDGPCGAFQDLRRYRIDGGESRVRWDMTASRSFIPARSNRPARRSCHQMRRSRMQSEPLPRSTRPNGVARAR